MPQWIPDEKQILEIVFPRKLLTNRGKNLAERFSGSAGSGVQCFERFVVIIFASGACYTQGSLGANLHDR